VTKDAPIKVISMAKKKLSTVTKVATAESNDYIVMNASDGKTVQIRRDDLATIMADIMRTATAEKNGLLSLSLFNKIKNHATNHSDGNGANLNQPNGRPCLVVAYDNRYFGRYLIYVYWSNAQRTSHSAIVLAKSDGMSIKASNNVGTVAIDEVPAENVEQYSLYF